MDDSKKVPTIRVTYLDNLGDVAVGNPYGIHSSPSKDSPALIFQINNDPTNTIIIPLSMFIRNKNLAEGEVEIGAFDKKSWIKFDKDGNIIMTTPSGKVTMSNGSNNLTDLIKQLCEACASMTTLTAIGAQPPLNAGTFSSLASKVGEFVE